MRFNVITKEQRTVEYSKSFVDAMRDEDIVFRLIDELKDPRDQADYYELCVFHIRNACEYEDDNSLILSISESLQERAARYGANARRASDKQIAALQRAWRNVYDNYVAYVAL